MIKKDSIERKNKFKAPKILVGALLLSIGIGTGNAALASQDINGLLTSWFDRKTTESITEIEKGINSEKEASMVRLKEELQLEMKKSEEEIRIFTESEKEKRIEELRTYTNDLINNINVNDEEEQKRLKSEIETIMQQAINQMNEVKPSIKVESKTDNVEKQNEESQQEQ